MIIRCREDPKSCLKAVLLSRLNRAEIAWESEPSQSLFDEVEISASREPWAGVLTRYEKAFGRVSWLHCKQDLEDLLSEILFVFRFPAKDNLSLVVKAIGQGLDKGYAYVVNRASREARLFHERAHQVRLAWHKSLGLMRFAMVEKGGTKALIAKCPVPYRIADLAIWHFVHRFPDFAIVIVAPEGAAVVEDGAFRWEDPSPYESYLKEDNFDALWQTFYKSQYIPERRNRRLAMRGVPKKYWAWVTEGQAIDDPGVMNDWGVKPNDS
jgi:probable DNA metabolism protein